MSNIGLFRHRMQIQSYAEVMDSSFKTVPTWTTLITMYAKIETPKGRAYLNGQQTDERITHKITIRYPTNQVPAITTELWLMMESRRFRIRSVKDLYERHRFLELLCEEVFMSTVDFTSDTNAAETPLRQDLPAVN